MPLLAVNFIGEERLEAILAHFVFFGFPGISGQVYEQLYFSKVSCWDTQALEGLKRHHAASEGLIRPDDAL